MKYEFKKRIWKWFVKDIDWGSCRVEWGLQIEGYYYSSVLCFVWLRLLEKRFEALDGTTTGALHVLLLSRGEEPPNVSPIAWFATWLAFERSSLLEIVYNLTHLRRKETTENSIIALALSLSRYAIRAFTETIFHLPEAILINCLFHYSVRF